MPSHECEIIPKCSNKQLFCTLTNIKMASLAQDHRQSQHTALLLPNDLKTQTAGNLWVKSPSAEESYLT